MPLIHFTPDRDDVTALDTALHRLAPGTPVTLMIHGFKFAPGILGACPFRDILSLTPVRRARAVSWPRHLGVGRSGAAPEPLCIAVGWNARGSIWGAWRRARTVGATLAALLDRVQVIHDCPAGIIAHSLGARVALSAIRNARAGSVGRVILLAGAAFRGDARIAMASPAGTTAEVLNITSRENAFFDGLIELTVGGGRRAVGRGLHGALPRWIDLPIDNAATRAALRDLGHPIARPVRRVCHWSGYLRAGLFPLYRRWLGNPTALPFETLAACLAEPAAPVRPLSRTAHTPA